METFLWPEIAPIFGGWPFNPDEEGHMTFTCPRWGGPNAEVPFIAMAADYGDIVHGILLAPEKYNGRLIQGISQSRALENVIPDYQTGEDLLVPWPCPCPWSTRFGPFAMY